MPEKRCGGSLTKWSSDSKRMRNARSNETESQRIERQQVDSLRHAHVRSNETEEQRIARQQADSQRHTNVRLNETEEQRIARLQADSQSHADAIIQETPAQQQASLRNNKTNQRLRQTLGNANTRNANAKRLAEELNTPGDALRYNNDLDYSLLSNIGAMADTQCRRCGAKKWKREPDGMCCPAKQRWERYPQLQEPEDPLKTLFKAETADSKHFLENIDGYNNCFSMTSFGADKRVSDN